MTSAEGRDLDTTPTHIVTEYSERNGDREVFCPGEGGTPYNGLYGEASPEKGTFFRLQVYERVGI